MVCIDLLRGEAVLWSAYSSDSRRWAHLASVCVYERLRPNQGCVGQRAPVNKAELGSCNAIVSNAKPRSLALQARQRHLEVCLSV